MERGMIVKSTSGHDKDSFYVVVDMDGDFCLIADGRRRKVEHPKRKNAKHLQATVQRAEPCEYETNKQLRRRLWGLNFGPEAAFTE